MGQIRPLGRARLAAAPAPPGGGGLETESKERQGKARVGRSGGLKGYSRRREARTTGTPEG